jgi:hypothetical protein
LRVPEAAATRLAANVAFKEAADREHVVEYLRLASFPS